MIKTSPTQHKKTSHSRKNENRMRLLKGLPVTDKIKELAGISTAILEGGNGPPIILLHGPGENAFWWMRIIPELVATHRVIVPDLPGHAASKVINNSLEPEQIFSWLSEMIGHTCTEPPVVVGHVLGGSIAARFAIAQKEKLRQLVLVDSLGLGKFRPSLRFAFGVIRFMFQPTEKNYHRFLPHCLYDIENLVNQMGAKWDAFIAYNLECANDPDHKAATQTLMKKMGVPRIPSNDLAGISVPTSLIWGRHDRVNKMKIAEEVSEHHGWPLYIIENARDDPKLEQPKEFVNALNKVLWM